MKEITMDTARQIAARIWCDPEYAHVEMNTTLAENIALLLFGENYRQADKDHMFAGQPAEPQKPGRLCCNCVSFDACPEDQGQRSLGARSCDSFKLSEPQKGGENERK